MEWLFVMAGLLILWFVWDFIIDRPTDYQRKMREQVRDISEPQTDPGVIKVRRRGYDSDG